MTLSAEGSPQAALTGPARASTGRTPRRNSVLRGRTGVSLAVVVLSGFWVFSELVIPYSDTFNIAGLKPRYYIVALLLLLLMPRLSQMALRAASGRVRIESGVSTLLVLWLVFTINGVLVSELNGTWPGTNYLVFQYFLPIIVLLVSLIAFRASPKALLQIIVAVTTLSAGFSVLQAIDLNVVWNMRAALSDLMPSGWRQTGRTPGLSHNPVRFSETLLLGAAVTLAFAAFDNRHRRIWTALFVLHVIVIFFSGTRSSIASVLALPILLAWLAYPKKRLPILGWVLILGTLGFVALFGLLPSQIDSRILSFTDTSAQVRVAFIQIALMAVVDNPIGYGAQSFAYVMGDQASTLTAVSASDEVFAKIGEIESHSYLLNMLFYYGAQGLVIVLAIHLQMLLIARKLMVQPDATSRIYGFALYLAVVSQLIDSLVHNSGYLNGFGGLSFVAAAALIHVGISQRSRGAVPARARP